jgi:hypothetical protein
MVWHVGLRSAEKLPTPLVVVRGDKKLLSACRTLGLATANTGAISD